jgi:hypothetical protein
MKNFILFLILLFPLCSSAYEAKTLSGTYSVTAKTVIDTPDFEARDTHYRITLTGDSAKDLYMSIKSESVKDGCTGAMNKSVGEMKCLYYKEKSVYECDFSINIEEQKVEYGNAC